MAPRATVFKSWLKKVVEFKSEEDVLHEKLPVHLKTILRGFVCFLFWVCFLFVFGTFLFLCFLFVFYLYFVWFSDWSWQHTGLRIGPTPVYFCGHLQHRPRYALINQLIPIATCSCTCWTTWRKPWRRWTEKNQNNLAWKEIEPMEAHTCFFQDTRTRRSGWGHCGFLFW